MFHDVARIRAFGADIWTVDPDIITMSLEVRNPPSWPPLWSSCLGTIKLILY
jgi:hypothetical protein